MKLPKEQDILNQCLQWLQLKGYHVWRQNQGGMKASYKGKSRFIKFCSMPGVSDIIGFSPNATFVAVEVKRPGKETRSDQEDFLNRVREAGGIALCVHSLDELIRELEFDE
jgi:hypothetical protein